MEESIYLIIANTVEKRLQNIFQKIAKNCSMSILKTPEQCLKYIQR